MRDDSDTAQDGFWDLYARFYDAIFVLMPYRKLLWDSFQALDLAAGMRVLDAGCGTGNFEAFIAEKDLPSVDVTAIDFSPHMLAIAREKCAALDWVRFGHGDLNASLPYADATFDRIVSINVMYTLEDWDRTLAEFVRVLKPNGVLVFTSSVPDFHATPLFADHLHRVRNIWGLRRRIGSVARLGWTLCTRGAGTALLNIFVINRREADGHYLSLKVPEVREFLERNSSLGLASFDVTTALADQNFFARATKAAIA